MSNNTTILTGYSFLAALNETGADMYNAVYVPMCKRAVSLYASSFSPEQANVRRMAESMTLFFIYYLLIYDFYFFLGLSKVITSPSLSPSVTMASFCDESPNVTSRSLNENLFFT